MKRKALALFLFLFIFFGFTSCESLNDCEVCKFVTKNSDGVVTDTGLEAEYCGATLVAFKAANPDITNPVTGAVTSLECN
jgi:Ca2+/Na+ antiporter